MPATAPDYHLLAAFVAVAERGSFSKAAKRLGITKGTVSRAIARLEDTVGAELIHRDTHKVALSTAGIALYERTAPHLAALDRAIGTMPERSEEPSGQLRVTAPNDFAAIVLPDLLAQFLVRFPGIRVDLRVTNARVDLIAEGFDLAVRASSGKLADSRLTARRLGAGSMGCFASPTYLARRGEPRSFGDSEHEWIVLPAMLSVLGLPQNFQPRVLVDDLLTAGNLVAEGAGVGLLPDFVADPHRVAGRVTATRLSLGLGPVGLHLVYPSSGQVPRKVAAFRDFLLERLKTRALRP